MSIKFVKLITGEDVVADITEQNDNIILKNPTQLVMLESGPGLVPYSPLSEGDISIRREHILYCVNVRSEVMNIYQVKFGGVIQADSNDLNKITKKKLFV